MIILQYRFLLVLAVLVPVSTIPFALSASTSNPDQINTGYIIPSWIKNNAGWWANDMIDDSSFVSGLQWMISNDIITLPPTEQGTNDGEDVIPSWVKKTAGWWAGDEIHDITFVAAVKYLIGEGIIIIEQEIEEVEESVEEIAEIKEFDMIVNSHGCSLCTSWAHVGEEYHFQIETFDEERGSLIDGVTITAKIISQNGELRHDFGIIETEDGIYSGSIAIPNMDWYAGNILSVTAAHNEFEKTIEKEFEVFHAKSGSSNAVTMTGAGDCALVSPVSVKSLNAADGKPQGIEFSSDGTKMFTTGNPSTADSVWYYELDGPYCISTATYVNALNVESRDNTPTGVAFNPTGTKMYVIGKGSDVILQYDLSSRFLPVTASFVYSMSTTVVSAHAGASVDNAPEDIHFNPTGTKMFIVGSENDEIHQYSMYEPFTLSNATHNFTLSVNSEETSPAGIHLNPTGTKMFIVGNGHNEVNQYTLSTPFVLSTASHDYAFSVNSQENNARGIAFDSSGKKMFIIGFTGDDVNVYELSTPFVLSSASFVS